MKLTKKEDLQFENLHFAAQAVARLDVRDYLNVLHVHRLDDIVYAIGSDGYRMHWARCDLQLGTYAVEKSTKTILVLNYSGESTLKEPNDIIKRSMLLDSVHKFHCSDLISTILRLWTLQPNPEAVNKKSVTYNPDYLEPIVGLDFIGFDGDTSTGGAYFTDGILHALVMPRGVI